MADFPISALTGMNDSNHIENLLAGRLEPRAVLWAYAHGIFPMADPDTQGIEWYSPDPRGVMDLEDFHIPHTLRNTARKGIFRVTLDRTFERVIRECGRRESTWINDAIIDCYVALYKMGFGHSVETWQGEELAGGLYGVAIGGAFFGESMFHTRTDASKVALVALVQQLREQKFILLDTQFITSHLIRFGARNISRKRYLTRLAAAIRVPSVFRKPDQHTVEIDLASFV